jgi:hypothetical protein
VACVNVPIRPSWVVFSFWVEPCVLMSSQSNPPELFGLRTWVDWGLTPRVVVARPELYGFRLGFSYKLGQLSSSNKNSGKHKLLPSVQEKMQKTCVFVMYILPLILQKKIMFCVDCFVQ